MKLEDRIENIKTLLRFCPQSTADVKIIEEKVGLFFANLFNNDERFKHTPYDRVYPRIWLSRWLNRDYKTHSDTIAIEYVYDNDRDGEYGVSYYFNDPDLEDACFSEDIRTYLEYSEVPDHIWNIIQKELYDKALKDLNNKLFLSKESVKHLENQLGKFNDIKLKE